MCNVRILSVREVYLPTALLEPYYTSILWFGENARIEATTANIHTILCVYNIIYMYILIIITYIYIYIYICYYLYILPINIQSLWLRASCRPFDDETVLPSSDRADRPCGAREQLPCAVLSGGDVQYNTHTPIHMCYYRRVLFV